MDGSCISPELSIQAIHLTTSRMRARDDRPKLLRWDDLLSQCEQNVENVPSGFFSRVSSYISSLQWATPRHWAPAAWSGFLQGIFNIPQISQTLSCTLRSLVTMISQFSKKHAMQERARSGVAVCTYEICRKVLPVVNKNGGGLPPCPVIQNYWKHACWRESISKSTRVFVP